MTDEKKSTDDGKGPLGGDLSSLWQSALGQIDEIRDAIVRGSHAGKAKLDAQLLKRQRDKLLAQLGERLLMEHRRGAALLPEGCEELVRSLEDTEAQIVEAEREADQAFPARR